MTFQFLLTLDDLVAYNLHVYQRHLAQRALVVQLGVSLLVGGCLLFLLRQEPPVAIIVSAVAIPFLFAFFRVSQARALAQNVRRMFGRHHDPTSLGPHRVSLERDYVRIELPHVRSEFDWEVLTDVVETPNHLFIGFGPVRSLVVPLNDTLTGASREEIVHAFRKRLPPRE